MKHGLSHSSVYRCWVDMVRRCQDPRRPDYKYYGGRGIKVCESWLKFENFYADMGDNNGLSLDRLDNNGNYELSNCKWATHSEQMKNRRAWREDKCKNGHEYSGINSRGYKVCQACNRIAVKKYAERNLHE